MGAAQLALNIHHNVMYDLFSRHDQKFFNKKNISLVKIRFVLKSVVL